MESILKEFKKYFDLREVVSPQVYKKLGTFAWAKFDIRILAVVLWIREGMGIRLVCNNWASGGSLTQRGYRCNLDPIVLEKTKKGILYCTAHEGQGFDLSSPDASAYEIRKWIRQNINECPYPIRLEDDKSAPTWVHVDVCNVTDKKLVEFSA